MEQAIRNLPIGIQSFEKLRMNGYLTILDAPEDDILTLGFPNEEVSHAFLQSLLPEYVNEYTHIVGNRQKYRLR